MTAHPAVRCAAITGAGGRCSRRAHCFLPVTFRWDPVRGEGIAGPWVGLCEQHYATTERNRDARLRLAHGGWLGYAMNGEVRTVCRTVFAGPKSPLGSQWWWKRRRPAHFGDVVTTSHEGWTA